MKKWLLAVAVVMFALPWATVTFVRNDAAMAICLLLFFAVNPVFAILAGVFAGGKIQTRWSLPLVTAICFLAGTWLIIDPGESAFALYAGLYFLLGMAAMLLSYLYHQKAKQ